MHYLTALSGNASKVIDQNGVSNPLTPKAPQERELISSPASILKLKENSCYDAVNTNFRFSIARLVSTDNFEESKDDIHRASCNDVYEVGEIDRCSLSFSSERAERKGDYDKGNNHYAEISTSNNESKCSEDSLNEPVASTIQPSQFKEEMTKNEHPFFNPLHIPSVLQAHLHTLRLESSQNPFNTLLSRLMNHTLNRHIFNTPVDAVSLGLIDYNTIITEPMDLGTIKEKLHAMVYSDPKRFARDVRLTFENAMRYNPRGNPVHEAASALLGVFDNGLNGIVKENENLKTINVPIHVDALKIPSSRAKKQTHSCTSCQGHSCPICFSPCHSLEPALLICNGPSCCQKVCKSAVYHVAPDGSKIYCHKCYTNLPPIIPSMEEKVTVRYKSELLKRRNDENMVEQWVECTRCHKHMHEFCAIFNNNVNKREHFVCPMCICEDVEKLSLTLKGLNSEKLEYSFFSGCSNPKPMLQNSCNSAKTLPICSLGKFIEEKVRTRMVGVGCIKHAEQTVTVRVISNTKRKFRIPKVIQKHFQTVQQDEGGRMHQISSEVYYRSKVIALFQRIDGIDICLFCMYIQEYNDPCSAKANPTSPGRRTYIAYLDSVDYMRPRKCRSPVYQEILISYLASARASGIQTAHIWACPPCRGNSFVFWVHPPQQRTPNQERLVGWYHKTLARAVKKGIITDVNSLYDMVFSKNKELDGTKVSICPPLFDGDFWMEEAKRAHQAALLRHLKFTTSSQNLKKLPLIAPAPWKTSSCPAVQVAAIIQTQVILNPKAFSFRRPVNAAGLKLKDYHDVVKTPMDLGTIHGKCLVGDYDTFGDVMTDVALMVENATKYNPPGHVVHNLAIEMMTLVKEEMKVVIEHWKRCGEGVGNADGIGFSGLSMRLSKIVKESDFFPPTTPDDMICELIKVVGSDVSLRPDSVHISNKSDVNLSTHAPSLINTLSRNTYPLSMQSALSHQTSPKRPIDKPPPKKPNKRQKKAIPKLNLLTDGLEAIAQRMAGDEKPPDTKKSKKKKSPNEKSVSNSSSSNKRESWLGEEVGETIEILRKDFFVCDLTPHNLLDCEKDKVSEFERYVDGYNFRLNEEEEKGMSGFADMRNVFLEVSQFRNFQFDTLRRAKFSSLMLLYHLHHPLAQGLEPICSHCNEEIKIVRWHRIKQNKPHLELCVKCHSGIDNVEEEFIPIKISEDEDSC